MNKLELTTMEIGILRAALTAWQGLESRLADREVEKRIARELSDKLQEANN
jgi:hypothetical protein